MATTATQAEVKSSTLQYLRTKNLPPTQKWLDDFTRSVRPNTPLLALHKTALFRILAADLTTSVQLPANGFLPPQVAGPETKEMRLSGPITVQVLDIEDIGHSRWSQVENIEAHERGEMTKGREIIRVVDDETNTDPSHGAPNQTRSSGPHKLLLQDANGTKVYGFEVESVPGVGVHQLSLGAKLVLRNVLVARGVAMLDGEAVEVLGGKIEAWDLKWRAERKERLKQAAGLHEAP